MENYVCLFKNNTANNVIPILQSAVFLLLVLSLSHDNVMVTDKTLFRSMTFVINGFGLINEACLIDDQVLSSSSVVAVPVPMRQ